MGLPEPFFLFSLVLFGLLFGSLANVIIWRFPRGESLWSPGSHCPRCGIPIKWYDNIPVASWLALRGQCRSCKAPISWRYPVVESISGVLWLLAGLTWGQTRQTAFAIALFYLLLVLSFIDLDHMRLPNPIVGLLGGVGTVGVVWAQLASTNIVPLVGVPADGYLASPLATAAVGVLLGAGVSLLIAVLYGAVRGKSGFGMGDVKLLAALGPFLGAYTLMTLLVGSMFGAVAGVALARGGEGPLAQRKIPFGPFLALGAVASAVAGPALWGWYAGLVGL